ncbi:hypothetical protein JHK85_046283 [Glycine max]|nr:hypothetical protein JHK85_046283 [Glycine max]
MLGCSLHAKRVLLKMGIRGVTVSDVRGFGAQGGQKRGREFYTCFYAYRSFRNVTCSLSLTPLSLTNRVFLTGSEFPEDNFVAKVKMEVVVRKDQGVVGVVEGSGRVRSGGRCYCRGRRGRERCGGGGGGCGGRGGEGCREGNGTSVLFLHRRAELNFNSKVCKKTFNKGTFNAKSLSEGILNGIKLFNFLEESCPSASTIIGYLFFGILTSVGCTELSFSRGLQL